MNMKHWIYFAIGVVVGFCLCLAFGFISLFLFGLTDDYSQEQIREPKKLYELSLFEQPGDCISSKDFKVTKVDEQGNAFARERDNDRYESYYGMTVLFLAEEGKAYYDEQIIKIPKGKCVKQLGIYKYKLSEYSSDQKTIPAVAIR